MANNFEFFAVVFNRILDITACINIPLKLFTIYVVLKFTPLNLRYYSYFILNIMIWNFLINFVFTFVHLHAMFPVECFKLHGLSSYFIDSEVFGHFIFILMFYIISECGLALLFVFPYRYIVFAHPKLAYKIRPAWVFALCGAIHVAFIPIYLSIIIGWTVSYDDYPNKAELPPRPFVFCFYLTGGRKIAAASTYIVLIFVTIGVITTSSALFLRHLRRQKSIIHVRTLALQKKLFVSLIILTGIVVIFGGVPLFICMCGTLFPHIPHIREVCMICIIILCNHGTIYAVAYLVLFKAYRDAVKRMFSKAMGLFYRTNNVKPPPRKAF